MKETNGEIINVGPDTESCTIQTLAEMVARRLRFDLEPIYVEGRPNEVKIALCSSEKARRLLGYEAKTTQADGLSELVDWIQAKGAKPFEYHLDLEIVNEKTPRTWANKLM